MIIEQIYTGCLSQGAYYIESNGEAAIIDPLREVDQYILKAKKNKASIKYIFETHFHADFVSGHLTLSKKTNAPIIYGPNANTSFESINAKDGQRFDLGEISIEVLHTPGHTMESSCYLLRDKKNTQIALFSGDTVFMGDVGRPDLAQKSELSKEEILNELTIPGPKRIFYVADAIRNGWNLDKIHSLTKIDYWFLDQINEIIEIEKDLTNIKENDINEDYLWKIKQKGFSDSRIAELVDSDEEIGRAHV